MKSPKADPCYCGVRCLTVLSSRRLNSGVRRISYEDPTISDADWSHWLRLSLGLGLSPHHSVDELSADMREWRERSDAAVFVAERVDGSLAGYVEVGTRPHR